MKSKLFSPIIDQIPDFHESSNDFLSYPKIFPFRVHLDS